MRPDVPGVQEFVLTETPCEELAVPELTPLIVSIPEVLVIELVDPAMFTPILASALAPVVPVREMFPVPVVVEMSPVLLMLMPWEAAVVLAPPAPTKVTLPPPVVPSIPPVMEIP